MWMDRSLGPDPHFISLSLRLAKAAWHTAVFASKKARIAPEDVSLPGDGLLRPLNSWITQSTWESFAVTLNPPQLNAV
jgi:hypothetical protein